MARSIRGGTPDAPLLRLIRRGVFARVECDSPGCSEVQTAQCVYVDRHGVACSTHWCKRHAQGHQRKAYCPVHIVTVAARVPTEHRVAIALDWLGHALDDDIVALLRPVAERLGENMMSEPVRFAAVGGERTRLWERTWKTYSETGVGCRVSLGIEDREPDVVQIRVNGTTVTTIMTPWELVAAGNPLRSADRLTPFTVAPAGIAIDVWLQNMLVQLKGAPYQPQ